jgi:class 3 adenylate cyclase/tetratricopeptide (TPR) repeat protein
MKTNGFIGILIIFLLAKSIIAQMDEPVHEVLFKDTLSVIRYNQKAEYFLSSNNIDSAYFYTNKAIKLSREYSYRKGKADAYRMLAEIELSKANPPVALRYLLGAIREYEFIQDIRGTAKSKIKIGEIYQEAGLLEKALENYLSAEKELLQIGSTLNTEFLALLANLYIDLQQYEKAYSYFKRLENIYIGDELKEKQLEVWYDLVKCTNHLGRFEESLVLNEKILEQQRNQNNKAQEIITLSNIGFTYKNLSKFQEALDYFRQSLQLGRELNGSENPLSLVNIAIVYQNLGDYKNSIDYMQKAERLVEQTGDNSEMAKMDHLVSIILFKNNDLHNAQIYNKEAIRLARNSKDPNMLEAALLVSSKIYQALYDYENAMVDYSEHLRLKDSLLFADQTVKNQLMEQQFIIERTEKEIEMLIADEDIKDLEYQRLRLESATQEQELQLFRQNDSIQKITIQNQNLEKNQVLQEKLLAEERLNAEIKDNEIQDLKQKEEIQTLQIERQELIQKEQENEITLLNKENEINELNLNKVKARNRFLLGLAALALLILYLVYRGLRFAKKTNKLLVKQNNEIERQRDEIDHERKRSDKLLLNILPEETAAELKEKGSATPRHYEQVSVLFTDFVGFTKIAEKLTPQELVLELDKCFLEFDKIIDRYHLEKIKTIGDAYMCAGGIPIPNITNPVDIVKAGLEIKAFMNKLKEEKEAIGEDFWELRIGIHTGSVVAGVVGKNKFAYDIWGDAVNTASRMESSGVAGKVNISGKTYDLVKDYFECTYRGKIKAKNKGEVDMYIVEKEN